MKTAKMVAAAWIAVALGAGAAWAGLNGVVTAINERAITLGNAAYAIEKSTSIEDLGGRTIGLTEIRPGTPVELDFDDEGKLATIRATVVR